MIHAMSSDRRRAASVWTCAGALLVLLPAAACFAAAATSPLGFTPRLELVAGASVLPCSVTVRILVDPNGATIDVSQFTVRFKSGCMSFTSATLGADAPVGSTLDWNVPPANTVFPICGAPACTSCDTDYDAHAVVLVTPPSGATYGGTGNKEIAVLHFAAATPGSSCSLEWDQSVPPGLVPTYVHLNTGDVYGAGIDFVPDTAPPSCPGLAVAVPQQTLRGTARYYFPLPQPNSNWLPALEACVSPPGPPSGCATTNTSGSYAIAGVTPGSRTLALSRPAQPSDPFAIGGGDINAMVQFLATTTTLTLDQQIAADVDRSGLPPNSADVQKLRRYLVFDSASCSGCATWTLFCDPQGTNAPAPCTITIPTCADDTVDAKGILLGDVDGSWPGRLKASAAAPIAVDFAPPDWSGLDFTLPLAVEIAGEALTSLIFTWDYDASAFEYLGASTTERTRDFDLTLNATEPGVLHGLLTGGTAVAANSGEILAVRFRLRQPQSAGRMRFSRLLVNDRDAAQFPAVEIERDRSIAALPQVLQLTAAPNPFNPMTRIEYAVPPGAALGPVVLRVLDLGGRVVREIVRAEHEPGIYRATWDGTTQMGDVASSGVYLLEIRAAGSRSVDKVVLLK